MASASVAQVHEALLYSGEEVVVKVIRPGIEKTIKKDMAVLFTIAQLVEVLWIEGTQTEAGRSGCRL